MVIWDLTGLEQRGLLGYHEQTPLPDEIGCWKKERGSWSGSLPKEAPSLFWLVCSIGLFSAASQAYVTTQPQPLWDHSSSNFHSIGNQNIQKWLMHLRKQYKYLASVTTKPPLQLLWDDSYVWQLVQFCKQESDIFEKQEFTSKFESENFAIEWGILPNKVMFILNSHFLCTFCFPTWNFLSRSR